MKNRVLHAIAGAMIMISLLLAIYVNRVDGREP